MIEENRELADLFKNTRPGYELIAIEDAALPVTMLQVEALVQERKPVSILEEFVLLLTQTGVNSVALISAFLGLEEAIVESTVAEQLTSRHLNYDRTQQTLSLTTIGRTAAAELASSQPVYRTFQVPFDREVWRIADYEKRHLLKKNEAIDQGIMLLPATQKKRISAADISVADINERLDQAATERRSVDVLSIRKVTSGFNGYHPVKLLIYGDDEQTEPQLGVVVNSEHSPEHDRTLAEMHAIEALQIRISSPAARPKIDDSLEGLLSSAEANNARNDASAIASSFSHLMPDDLRSESEQSSDDSNARRNTASAALVRRVGVHEHRDLLFGALLTAQHRILIISPWIKNAVITTQFLAPLEQRLRAGVRVHIAYGMGDDDSGSDENALKKLQNLEYRFPKQLTVARLQNTHAKILIFDDCWITTSFNWLSFRGDPDRTYRMEEGAMVEMPSVVDRQYQQYVSMISEQRAT